MFFGAGGAMIQSKWPFSHRHLDSWILIYHQSEFHLVVVLIHLWVLLCFIIGPRNLYTNWNLPLTVVLFWVFLNLTFVSDRFFFLQWSSGTLGAEVFQQSSACVFFCLFVVVGFFCNAHSMQTCIPLHGVDKVVQTQGSEGPSCSRDKARDLTSPWLWHHGQNTKARLICMWCIKTFLLLFEKQGFGIIIRQVSSDYIFMRCNARGSKDQVN